MMTIGKTTIWVLPVLLFFAIFWWPDGDADASTPAEQAVEIFDGIFPKNFDGGLYIAAPKAEGELLIFTISVDQDMSEAFSGSETAKMMRNAICGGSKRGMKSFFEDGGELRIDIKEADGSYYKGRAFSSCS